MTQRILSISRDATVLKLRNMLLEAQGYQTAAALNLLEVQQQLGASKFDLVVVGHTINPNEKRRVEALIREQSPGCPVLEMYRISPEIPGAEAHVRLDDDPEGLIEAVKQLLGRPKPVNGAKPAKRKRKSPPQPRS